MKKKTVRLNSVRPGERFELDGAEFIKLDEALGGAFVVAADTLPDAGPFEHEDAERDDHNNFVGSCLEADILEWADSHPTIKAAMLERPLSTVLSKYHRALGKLRAALAEQEV